MLILIVLLTLYLTIEKDVGRWVSNGSSYLLMPHCRLTIPKLPFERDGAIKLAILITMIMLAAPQPAALRR